MKKYLNEILAFWSAMPAGGKFFWSAIFVIFILPHIFIFVIYHTVYAAPWQKYFDVSERQILTIKENKLYLTDFYLCNASGYETFNNSTKKNYGRNMCGEEILIMENVNADQGSPQEDYYLPKNFSTAILPNNKIAWAYNQDPKYYEVNLSEVVRDENNNYKINTKSILKLEKFDLGTYADNLKKGKSVPSLSTIQKQTGHIWTKPFLVEDDAVVFYDAIVTKVDHEKPVEAMSRKWKIFTYGRVESEDYRRSDLDWKGYNETFVQNAYLYNDKKLSWYYFSKPETSIFQFNIDHYPFDKYINNKEFAYYSSNLQIDREQTTFFSGPLCNSYMLYSPCYEWSQYELTINSVKHEKTYKFRAGTILVFNLDNFRGNHTPIHGINNLRGVSQNEDAVSFYSGYGSYVYLMDLKTGGRIRLGRSDLQIIYIK